MTRRISGMVIGIVAAATYAAAQPPGGGSGVPGVRRGGPGDLGGALDGVRAMLAGGAGQLPVQGAPFSAEGVTTTTQTLADGTRIERTVTARIYRDSQGRV